MNKHTYTGKRQTMRYVLYNKAKHTIYTLLDIKNTNVFCRNFQTDWPIFEIISLSEAEIHSI